MKNLLEEWYKSAKNLSSPLLVRPAFEREKVEYIYASLLNFLGAKYFQVNGNEDKPIDKISWLFSLLNNTKHLGSISALFEVAELIEYSKQLPHTIKSDITNLKKSPQNLRTFFFELYIYKLLDNVGIPNEKKVMTGTQVIEGTCNLLDKTFLFECRKIYMPNIHELDVIRRLMRDFVVFHKNLRLGIGMICTITFNRPIKGEHRFSFSQKIQTYFDKLNKVHSGSIKINYTINDNLGQFQAINYSEADLFEIKTKKEYDLLFYIIPPKYVVPDVPNHYQVKIEANFSVYQSAVYKKLESALKEKKRQHRNSVYSDKIIFIDNEIFPEFHMGLFHGNLLDTNKVKEVYNKLNLEEVVCLITRDYSMDNPIKYFNFLYRENQTQFAQHLIRRLNPNN